MKLSSDNDDGDDDDDDNKNVDDNKDGNGRPETSSVIETVYAKSVQKIRFDSTRRKVNYNESGRDMSDNLELTLDHWISEEKCENVENVAELDVQKYESMLNLNKQILSQLSNLKVDITSALQKCERRLATIERSLQKHTVGERKVLICTAGIPYFKDRHYFFAPKNEDEILKESRHELQMVDLPKTSDWSKEDKDILVSAVKAEEEKQEGEGLAQAVSIEKIKRARYDGPTIVTERELDWLKISSLNYEQPHSPLDCRVIWDVFLHHSINKTRWTVKEDIKLKEIAKTCKFQDWEMITDRLGTQRTAYQCFVRYNTTKKLSKIQNYNWSSRDDKRLTRLVKIYQIGDFIPWGEIANWMPNRTKQQIYYRWTYSLAPHLSKGRFTREEDSILMDGVAKFGRNFHKISAVLMPHRSTVQLHYRHETLILNEINDRNPWTLEEDAKLLDLFYDTGPNWSALAKLFPSKRSRTQLRQRFSALQKYIKRGVSLLDLHYNEITEGRDLTLTVIDAEPTNGKDSDKCDNDDGGGGGGGGDDDDNKYWIDQKLIAHFRMKYRKEKTYTKKSIKYNVNNLCNTLRQLDTVLFMPDEDIEEKLSGANRKLAFTLKDHVKKQVDEKHVAEVIDKYRLRMFACSNDEEILEEPSPRFIPPLPFDLQQQKPKRSRESTRTIDYGLNRNNNFLLDTPMVFDTPDNVVSYIDKENREFDKLLASYGTEGKFNSNVVSSLVSTEPTLDKRMSIWMSQDLVTGDASDRSFFQNAKDRDDSRISFTYRYSGQTQDAPVINATHATLSSFRFLTQLKRLNEKNNVNNLLLVQLNQYHESIAVLETRLEQLFKYPIGMSQIDFLGNGSNSFSFTDVDADSNANVQKKCVQRKH